MWGSCCYSPCAELFRDKQKSRLGQTQELPQVNCTHRSESLKGLNQESTNFLQCLQWLSAHRLFQCLHCSLLLQTSRFTHPHGQHGSNWIKALILTGLILNWKKCAAHTSLGEHPETMRLPLGKYQLQAVVLETYHRLGRKTQPVWKETLTRKAKSSLPPLIWIKQIDQAQVEKKIQQIDLVSSAELIFRLPAFDFK